MHTDDIKIFNEISAIVLFSLGRKLLFAFDVIASGVE
jgi:hypothetical protein